MFDAGFTKTYKNSLKPKKVHSHLTSAWAVMGVSLLMRTKKLRSHRGRSTPSNCLLVLLILCGAATVANCRKPKECSVDRCSDVFREASYAKTNLEHCKKLKVHKKCLGRMKKVCRGNLMYHSNVHINKARMKEYDCLNVFNNVSKPPTTSPPQTKSSLACKYKAKGEYKFCGVFGDPHIRTFNDELITCKTNGSWTLVENDHIVVMATNAIVSHQTGATATVKLTVIVKENEECAKTSTYRADVNRPLPTTFIDGSTYSGPHSSVNITLRDPDTEIQINVRHIDTTIIIRKIGGHLTFAITIPDEFTINPKQRQMCFDGCPKDMQMSHPELLKKTSSQKVLPKFNEQQAREYCRTAMLEELKPCGKEEVEEVVLSRNERSADDKKKSRAKKEVTPPLMKAESIADIANGRARYTQEDAAMKSWQQLSSGDTNSKQNRRKRKHRNRESKKRSKDRSNIPINDEPNIEEKLKDFQEKLKEKLNPTKNENNVIKNETNFYFEACVFDLRTTGDVTYAKSARAAYDDVTKMHSKKGLAPSASKNVLCSLEPYKEPLKVTENPNVISPSSGSVNARGSFIFVIICSLLTTSFLNFNIFIFLSSINVSLFNRRFKT